MLSPEQHMQVLAWLENLHAAGYTLQEVIDGVKDGSLAKSSPTALSIEYFTKPNLSVH